MKFKIFKKLTALFLVGIMCINSYSFSANAQTISNFNIEYVTVKEDDTEYTLKIQTNGDTKSISITNDMDKDYIQLNINDDTVSCQKFEYEGKTFWGKEKFDETLDEVIEVDEIVNDIQQNANIQAQAITYNSKTYSPWEYKKGYQHWYQWSNNQGTTKYLKIGCIASYQIKYTSQNSTVQGKADKYTECIRSSRSYYATGLAICGTVSSGQIIACIIALGAASALSGGLVLAICGGYATGVTAFINSYWKYKDADDYYEYIKSYGTKL